MDVIVGVVVSLLSYLDQIVEGLRVKFSAVVHLGTVRTHSNINKNIINSYSPSHHRHITSNMYSKSPILTLLFDIAYTIRLKLIRILKNK
jgi:hypothetical protein